MGDLLKQSFAMFIQSLLALLMQRLQNSSDPLTHASLRSELKSVIDKEVKDA